MVTVTASISKTILPVIAALLLALVAPVLAQTAPATGPGETTNAAPVTSDPKAAQAKLLFEQGLNFAHEERWADARDAFQKARALTERPSVLFNLASALVRLGQYGDALRAVDDFERIAPGGDPQRSEAARLRALIEPELARLTLQVQPASAQVSLDGTPQPGTGNDRSFLADAGEHALRVYEEGYLEQKQTLRLERGQQLELSVSLSAIEQQAPTAALALEQPPLSQAQPSQASGGLLHEPWFWIVSGVVIAGTAVGLGFALAPHDVADSSGGTTGAMLQAP